jgi:citrate lyase subunit beta/citryl-CoA lyase
MAAVAASGADAVLLPKVESPGMVREALGALAAGGAPPALALWCMLETPRGVLDAAAIAAASPRVGALVMGTSDLTKDLHARHTRDRLPLLLSLELCVLAARAAGVAALDGVHLDLDDDEGFTAACRQAADLGFDGKTLIHPKTIAAANEVFAPAAPDVAWARRVMAAHAEAVVQGRGVAVLDGRLIERLHVEDARRVVALAEAIEARALG